MNSGLIKHVFPGSNTPQGFYSFFPHILPQNIASHLYIIKGGPGTGKSSFMKRLGTYAIAQGYNVEYHHCSSDPHSLDGLVIPALQVAFLDGTSPHTVDPIHPGAVDSILNFGEFWDEDKLIPSKQGIMDCSKKISNLFKKTYFYLAAAKSIYDSYVFSESGCINTTTKVTIENQIYEELFGKLALQSTLGAARHLFSTSISCDGIIDYLHTIIADTKNVYFIKETWGCNSKALMSRLADSAIRFGLDIECFHSPLDPEKIEDILIPSLDTVITVSNSLHKPKVFPTHIYDLTTALDSTALRGIDMDLERDKKLFNELIDRGVNCLAQEKKLHDVLEEYYINAINFEGIDTLYEKLIQTLFPTPQA